jgi:hypothetical protein
LNLAGDVFEDCQQTDVAGYPHIPDVPRRTTVLDCLMGNYIASKSVLAKQMSNSRSLYVSCDSTSKRFRKMRAIAIGGLISRSKIDVDKDIFTDEVLDDDTIETEADGVSSIIITGSDGHTYEFWETVLELDDVIDQTGKGTVNKIIQAFNEINDIQRNLGLKITTICSIDSIVYDNASENTGKITGVGVELNAARKLIEPNCADIVLKGCYDHILNLVSKSFQKKYNEYIEANNSKFNNLLVNGVSVVFEVISRLNNQNLRNRWAHLITKLENDMDVHLEHNIQCTTNRYLSAARTAANIHKSFGVDLAAREFMRWYGVSDASASSNDERDATVITDIYFKLTCLVLEIQYKLFLTGMEEANSIYEAEEYSDYITTQYNSIAGYLHTLQNGTRKQQQDRIQSLLEWSSDASCVILLYIDSYFEFMRDLLVQLFKLYTTLVKKHDGSFLDNAVRSDKIVLIRPTSRVVERYLGTSIKIMGSNSRVRALVIKAIIRLKTLQFDWRGTFNDAVMDTHYTEGRKELVKYPSHVDISRMIITHKTHKKAVQIEADKRKLAAKQLQEERKRQEKLKKACEKQQKELATLNDKQLLETHVRALLDDPSFSITESVTVPLLKNLVERINSRIASRVDELDGVERIKKTQRRQELISDILERGVLPVMYSDMCRMFNAMSISDIEASNNGK